MRQSSPMLFGVCLWLADRFNFDVFGVRLVFLLALIFGFGSPIPIYLILALIKPKYS
jgi:phage shock protein C